MRSLFKNVILTERILTIKQLSTSHQFAVSPFLNLFLKLFLKAREGQMVHSRNSMKTNRHMLALFENWLSPRSMLFLDVFGDM